MLIPRTSGFRFMIAAIAVGVFSVLIVVGHLEDIRRRAQQETETGWHVVSDWDRLPPPVVAAYSINLPALVISGPVRALLSSGQVLALAAAVGLYWFWIGMQLDYARGTWTGSRGRKSGIWFIRISSIAWTIFWVSGTLYLLWHRQDVGFPIILSSVIWSVALLFLSGYIFSRGGRPTHSVA